MNRTTSNKSPKTSRSTSDPHDQLPRLDAAYIVQEISNVLSFKKGILFTIRELLIRPGQSIRTFIFHDRSRLVKPIIFVIFCSFVYAILQQLLHFEDSYMDSSSDVQAPATLAIAAWIQGNYGYTNILMAGFMAFWIKMLFKKYDYTFFEIFVLLLFVFGVGMLIYALFGVIEALTDLRFIFIGAIIGLIYSTWAIVEFFEQRKIGNYLKALLSYILGMIAFTVIVFLLGRVIDSMILAGNG